MCQVLCWICHVHDLIQEFSVSGLLAAWTRDIFVISDCFVHWECSVTSLASTHWILVAPSLLWQPKNVSRLYQMSPGANHPRVRNPVEFTPQYTVEGKADCKTDCLIYCHFVSIFKHGRKSLGKKFYKKVTVVLSRGGLLATFIISAYLYFLIFFYNESNSFICFLSSSTKKFRVYLQDIHIIKQWAIHLKF